MPLDTVRLWLDQLNDKPESAVYIEWSYWHTRLGTGGTRADCFSADANEYRQMLNAVGTVTLEVVVPTDNYERLLFQVKP